MGGGHSRVSFGPEFARLPLAFSSCDSAHQAASGDVLVSQGSSVADAIRGVGVTEVTYYRWRQEYGGLKSGQVRRMKDLETENARLRKAIADLTLDKLILQEASRGNF